MSSAPSPLSTGQKLGRYELLMPIARGGMGQVWAARLRGARGFHKLVAIKTLLSVRGEEERMESLLLEEARIASLIHHSNVVQTSELGEHEGTLYLVMEWVDGEPLSVVLAVGDQAIAKRETLRRAELAADSYAKESALLEAGAAPSAGSLRAILLDGGGAPVQAAARRKSRVSSAPTLRPPPAIARRGARWPWVAGVAVLGAAALIWLSLHLPNGSRASTASAAPPGAGMVELTPRRAPCERGGQACLPRAEAARATRNER